MLRYTARGLTTNQTAERMGIVPRTVQLHLDSARAKLGAQIGRMELELSALQGANLSPRELEILLMLSRGLSLSDIAQRCEITVRTVHMHLTSLRSKLDANNTREAIAIAYKRGLIDVRV